MITDIRDHGGNYGGSTNMELIDIAIPRPHDDTRKISTTASDGINLYYVSMGEGMVGISMSGVAERKFAGVDG